MKIIICIALVLMSLFSCQSPAEQSDPDGNTELDNSKEGDLQSRAKRHVEAQLKIDATEKYTLTVFPQNLDGDGKEDALITVNRLDLAMKKAKESPNTAKLAEIGFVGNYNYLFFYDGGLDMISPPIAVPSSPFLPLQITFEPITSTEYNDILVTYRIRNSAFRAFYTIENHSPARYFEWPEFDELGTPNQKAFAFNYLSTAMNPRKNIQIYQANIELSDTVKNFNLAKPRIIKGQQLLHEFFYLPVKKTYVTKK